LFAEILREDRRRREDGVCICSRMFSNLLVDEHPGPSSSSWFPTSIWFSVWHQFVQGIY